MPHIPPVISGNFDDDNNERDKSSDQSQCKVIITQLLVKMMNHWLHWKHVIKQKHKQPKNMFFIGEKKDPPVFEEAFIIQVL